MSNKNLKSLTDKDLIIFLVVSGLEIKNVEKVGNKSLVYFDNDKRLNDTILNYANRSTEVNIGDYLAAEKRVMTMLYSQKQI